MQAVTPQTSDTVTWAGAEQISERCPIDVQSAQGVDDEVKEILAIAQQWGTAAAVPIGYPQLRGHGPISRRPVEEMAFIDSWDQPTSILNAAKAAKREPSRNAEHC